MEPEVEKHFRKAGEIQREIEHLVAGGFYRKAIGRAYSAMLSAAAAALLAKETQSGSRQAIVDEFNSAFIKTGMLDKKYSSYFSFAYNARTESTSSSFDSCDHRMAQSTLVKVKDFIEACRKLAE